MENFEQLDLKLSPVFKIYTFLSIKPGSNKMKSELKFRTVYNKKNGWKIRLPRNTWKIRELMSSMPQD